ncbi:hypothetical protein J3F83DRAFT_698799 [Trichoderma novae-zelandiae]
MMSSFRDIFYAPFLFFFFFFICQFTFVAMNLCATSWASWGWCNFVGALVRERHQWSDTMARSTSTSTENKQRLRGFHVNSFLSSYKYVNSNQFMSYKKTPSRYAHLYLQEKVKANNACQRTGRKETIQASKSKQYRHNGSNDPNTQA